jgi:RNA-directed DNA polymerase
LGCRGHRFVRYVDDVLTIVGSRQAAERVKASITRYLAGVLHLSVNEQKSRVAKLDECVFLGLTFMGTKLRWSDEAYADCRHRLRRLTGRSWGVSIQYRLLKLREYLRGWLGYSGISDSYRPVPEPNHWLRRRVRRCYWKQWPGCAPRSAT